MMRGIVALRLARCDGVSTWAVAALPSWSGYKCPGSGVSQLWAARYLWNSSHSNALAVSSAILWTSLRRQNFHIILREASDLRH
jgi:hypothetical protein